MVRELEEGERGGGRSRRKQRLFLPPSFLLKPEPGPGQASRSGAEERRWGGGGGGGRWGRKRACKHHCLHRQAPVNSPKVLKYMCVRLCVCVRN